MTNYTSIMVQAYSLSTGKSIQDSLIDLNIDTLIKPSEINQYTQEVRDSAVSLQKDAVGVLGWSRTSR